MTLGQADGFEAQFLMAFFSRNSTRSAPQHPPSPGHQRPTNAAALLFRRLWPSAVRPAHYHQTAKPSIFVGAKASRSLTPAARRYPPACATSRRARTRARPWLRRASACVPAHAYAANIKAIGQKRFIAPRLTPRPPRACKNKVYPLQAVDTALDCRPFSQKPAQSLSSSVSTNALEIVMGKIARIISIEWDTKENKIERMAKFRSAINELAVGIEISLVVNTDETSAMAIQVWPDEATAHALTNEWKPGPNRILSPTSEIASALKAMSTSGSSKSSILAPTQSMWWRWRLITRHARRRSPPLPLQALAIG